MIKPKTALGRWRPPASPWLIIGAAAILLVVLLVLAAQNYSREERYMSRILSEKGAAIIKALEAGARTGMMGMRWSGRQVQTLIEETAQLPDLLYITVIDHNGQVLAGSDRSLIGSQTSGYFALESMEPEVINWRFRELCGQRRAFEVFRHFQPLPDRETGNSMYREMCERGMTGTEHEWCFPTSPTGHEPVILVGLDPRPFQEARQEDIRNTALISGVLLLLGLAGFTSLFWLQSYRSARRSLQDTSAMADQIVTSLPVGLLATDRQGKFAFANRAAERITGLTLTEPGEAPADEMLPDYFRNLQELLDREGAIFEKEMEGEFAGGRVVPLSLSAAKIINQEGNFVGRVFIFRDLGEVRRLQDEIRRQEKLAAIGELAAGVAHEIRNPLSSIKGIASYYRNKFPDGSEDKELAGVMSEEVDRVSRVISELLELARPTRLELKPTNLNELLHHSARLIEQEAAVKKVEIALNLPAEPLMVTVDPDRLSQCLLNICLNSLQAMERGGRLTISCLITEQDQLIIEIRDSGPGIATADLARIFDPYFTTKPQGTGLGLAIVQKIVEAHQGQIKVRSTRGRGARFTIILPPSPPSTRPL